MPIQAKPNEPLPAPLPSPLLEGRFSGPVEFAALVRTALAVAASEGWREIIVSDATFEDWPLGERVVAQALNDWSQAGRKFTMLAKNYDEIVRRHARFVTWRRTWSHLIDCRSNSALSVTDMPSALWSANWAFRMLDTERLTGVAGSDAARRVVLKERLDECLRRSTPAFPASVLGI
jgi:hypothetical protein